MDNIAVHEKSANTKLMAKASLMDPLKGTYLTSVETKDLLKKPRMLGQEIIIKG